MTVADTVTGEEKDLLWGCSGPILPPQDLRLARRLGLRSYRIQIPWVRLQPKGRSFKKSPRFLDDYDRLADHLLEQDLEPVVCLHGGELPPALELRGGWTQRDTAKLFVDYSEAVARRLGDRVETWLTHRDLSAIATWVQGPPYSEESTGAMYLKAAHHLLLSHGWSLAVLRENCHRPLVGVELRCPEPDSAADRDNSPTHHRWFLDPIAGLGYPDEALYDRRERGDTASLMPDFVQAEDLGAICGKVDFLSLISQSPDPEREQEPLVDCLLRLGDRPLWLSLGQPAAKGPRLKPTDDSDRIRSLALQLDQVRQALNRRVPITGLMLGPLLDDEPWADGASPREGLIWEEPVSGRRWPRASALFLQRLIVEGRLDNLDLAGAGTGPS